LPEQLSWLFKIDAQVTGLAELKELQLALDRFKATFGRDGVMTGRVRIDTSELDRAMGSIKGTTAAGRRQRTMMFHMDPTITPEAQRALATQLGAMSQRMQAKGLFALPITAPSAGQMEKVVQQAQQTYGKALRATYRVTNPATDMRRLDQAFIAAQLLGQRAERQFAAGARGMGVISRQINEAPVTRSRGGRGAMLDPTALQRDFSGAFNSMRRVALDFTYTMQTMAFVSGGALYAIGSAIKGVGSQMTDASARMELYSKQFQALEGSAGAGEAALRKVRDFAVKSPLTFDETVQGVVRLRAAFVGMGEIFAEDGRLLKTLTNMAVYSKKPLEQVINTMLQLRRGGWRSRDMGAIGISKEFLQSIGVGWDSSKGIGRPEGLTAATGPEMFRKILQNPPEFLQNFDPAELLKTKLTNVEDVMFVFMASLGDRMAPAQKAFLTQLQEFLLDLVHVFDDPGVMRQMEGAMTQLFDAVGGKFIGFLEGLRDAITNDPGVIVDFLNNLAGAVKTLAAAFSAFLVGTGASMAFRAIAALMGLGGAIGGAPGAAIGGGIAAIGILGSTIATFVRSKQALDNLIPTLNTVQSELGDTKGAFEALTGMDLSFLGASGTMFEEWANRITASVKDAINAIQTLLNLQSLHVYEGMPGGGNAMQAFSPFSDPALYAIGAAANGALGIGGTAPTNFKGKDLGLAEILWGRARGKQYRMYDKEGNFRDFGDMSLMDMAQAQTAAQIAAAGTSGTTGPPVAQPGELDALLSRLGMPGYPLPPQYQTITSTYGAKRSGGLHGGLDIAAPAGTDVLSTAAKSEVLRILDAGAGAGGGKMVFVDAKDGNVVAFTHLKNVGFKAGDVIPNAGAKIGEVFKDHLDLKVMSREVYDEWVASGFPSANPWRMGKSLDPAQYFGLGGTGTAGRLSPTDYLLKIPKTPTLMDAATEAMAGEWEKIRDAMDISGRRLGLYRGTPAFGDEQTAENKKLAGLYEKLMSETPEVADWVRGLGGEDKAALDQLQEAFRKAAQGADNLAESFDKAAKNFDAVAGVVLGLQERLAGITQGRYSLAAARASAMGQGRTAALYEAEGVFAALDAQAQQIEKFKALYGTQLTATPRTQADYFRQQTLQGQLSSLQTGYGTIMQTGYQQAEKLQENAPDIAKAIVTKLDELYPQAQGYFTDAQTMAAQSLNTAGLQLQSAAQALMIAAGQMDAAGVAARLQKAAGAQASIAGYGQRALGLGIRGNVGPTLSAAQMGYTEIPAGWNRGLPSYDLEAASLFAGSQMADAGLYLGNPSLATCGGPGQPP